MGGISGPGLELGCGLTVIAFEAVTCAGRAPDLVEVAGIALHRDGGYWRETGRYSSLIRPPDGTSIPEDEAALAGISREMLSCARPGAEVLGEIDQRMGVPGSRLVAHGAGVEALLLRRQVQYCSVLAATGWIDTVSMARTVLPHRESYRLEAVLEHYQLPIPHDRHRAEPDAESAAQIFLRLLADGHAAGRWHDLAGLDQLTGRAPACGGGR